MDGGRVFMEMIDGESSTEDAGGSHGSIGAGVAGRRMVTLALMLAMAVAALEQTVVSTAMPTIIARLKGLDIYPWVFSAYLLASTVSTPLYGKLADVVGRKRLLLIGLGLFSLGSILSGCATSMPMLIAMRVIQGLGAGAIGPMVLTMTGDLFVMEERAKVQGWFSAVWGTSSLVGPYLGGKLTDRLSWRWVFFVTVPFSLVSAWILMRHVHERLDKRSVPPIDWAGAGLLACGSSALLLAVLGGADRPGFEIGVLLLASLLCLVLFVIQERRAADPILPIDLIARPAIAAAIVGSLVIGGLLFGIDTYIPLYVQGVLGGSATAAGQTITPMLLAWAISAAVAARLVLRFGFRMTALCGTLAVAGGMLTLTWIAGQPAWAGLVFIPSLFLLGIGMGPTSLCMLLDVQNAVAWNRRGAATGAILFSRTMGGALGVGLLGASLGMSLHGRLEREGAGDIDVAAALRPETHADLAPAQLQVVQSALGGSLRLVFLQMFALSAVGIVCASRLSPGRGVRPPEPHTRPVPEGERIHALTAEA